VAGDNRIVDMQVTRSSLNSLARSLPIPFCLLFAYEVDVGSLTTSHRYRTRVELLSPRRAFLCGSRSPYENASSGGL
jgi:hypothetical protein